MNRVLSVVEERFPIAGSFTISRGSKTEAEVIVCTVSHRMKAGRGECVPYRRYGETMESVRAEIEAASAAIVEGISRRAACRHEARRGAQRRRLRALGP